MTAPLIAIVVLGAVGIIPAWRLTTRAAEAILVSPLVGAVVIVPGAALAVALAGSPLVGAATGALLVNLVAWRAGAGVPRWAPAGSPAPVLATVAVLIALVVAHLTRAPVDWDAHSIWLYHSSWYAVGGDAARDAFGLEYFSHPDYPPLLTAPAGVLSRLSSDELDWRVAQTVITVIGWSAFVTAAALLVDMARRRWLTAAGMLATAGAAVSSLGFGVANGDADLAAAATALLATVALLVREEPGLVPLGLVAATAAALCKGESMMVAILVVGLAWWRRGRPWEARWAVPVVAALGWSLLVRALGAGSFLTREYRGLSIDRLVDRGWPGLLRIGEEMGSLAVAAAVASAGCALLVASSRRPLAILWALFAADVAALVLVYAIGSIEIQAWLDTSARRVATGPLLLAATAAVLALDRCGDLVLGGVGSGHRQGAEHGEVVASGQGSLGDRRHRHVGAHQHAVDQAEGRQGP